MKNGMYTVESIEQGLVRLLLREDESIEEYIPEEKFNHPISEGLLIKVKETPDGDFISKPEQELTQSKREALREKMERLKKR
ncbi:hypothetical protein [Jeotgalibacillus malaysiensis]|uniref:hypothetical protein n=1 Tax=Jeotgalibacillus malaysiensis TaxID=1508404 RepID=UPI00384E5EA4